MILLEIQVSQDLRKKKSSSLTLHESDNKMRRKVTSNFFHYFSIKTTSTRCIHLGDSNAHFGSCCSNNKKTGASAAAVYTQEKQVQQQLVYQL
jgi:hypothetical protein